MDQRELINDAEDTFRIFFDARLAQVWTALPGIVASADLSKQTLSVRPAIQGVLTGMDGKKSHVELPLLVDVPIIWPRAGGFACTLPVQPGDEVLVVFASRCIDGWWQSGGVQAQAEFRMHDLSDGFAIFAPTSQAKKLNDVQTDGIELRNEARDTFIKLTNGKIIIKGDIEHEGSTKQTGDYERRGSSSTSGLISGSGGFSVTSSSGSAAVSVSGDLVHTQGSITSLGKKIDGNHTHSVPQGGSTGVPNS